MSSKDFDMPEDDLAYLQRRAESELELAQRSEAPEVTAAHYKLAEAYLDRAAALRAAPAGEAAGSAAETAEAGVSAAPGSAAGERRSPADGE